MPHLIQSLSFVSALACLLIGGFVLRKNISSHVNRTFALGMASIAMVEIGSFGAARGDRAVLAGVLRWVLFAGELLLPCAWLVFGATFARKKGDRSPGRERIEIILVSLVSATLLAIVLADGARGVEPGLLRIQPWFSAFIILSLTIVIARLERTLRFADHEQRWAFKFLVMGIGSILAVRIYLHSQLLLFPTGGQEYSSLAATVVLVSCGLIAFSLIRHQLMGVDVFVSRHFVYNSFTVVAVGAYLLLVGMAGQAIRSFGGSFHVYLGNLFVFLTVLFLLMLLFSNKAQKRVKAFINRNFYRNRYDYHKEWLSLTDHLGSTLDIDELMSPIGRMFFENLWIEKTALWLHDDKDREFRRAGPAGWPNLEKFPAGTPLVKALIAGDYPIPLHDMEAGKQPAGVDDAEIDMFLSRGVSILVPLTIGGEVVGIFGLSKSGNSAPHDREDFDFIRTVARQAAGRIQNVKLSRRLIDAKEMETFHKFSTFVIHDLKNFVSMLSLVLQNADRNMDNPEFRKDAMESIAKTVDKMKRMMDRLSALARAPETVLVPVRLDDLARESLREMKGVLRSVLEEDIGQVPAISLDPVLMKQVVTNLVLNAEEATGGMGKIRVSTAARDGKILLSVCDDGCGMPADFVESLLFKPFSTTKSHGFGIGLYQVKGIVEAHGGRIDVLSAVGKGTTFTVSLPKNGER